jgi:hypothetical protein
MKSQEVEKPRPSSFRRKPESSNIKNFWTPAFAGVTAWKTFYERINHWKFGILRFVLNFGFLGSHQSDLRFPQ